MSILPNKEREDDKETLHKEEVKRINREEEEKMHNHANPNPNLGHEHNPQHHNAGGR